MQVSDTLQVERSRIVSRRHPETVSGSHIFNSLCLLPHCQMEGRPVLTRSFPSACQGQVPGAALPNPLNMLGPQASQLPCPPVTQPPLHQTPPPASTAAGMPSLQHPAAPGVTPPQPAAPTQPSTPASSSGQTPTPTPGSVPSASQTQSTPTVQAAAQAQVTPQPQTPVQPPSVATPQSSQQQPTPVHTQPPGTPVSPSACGRLPTELQMRTCP